jgi:hypothetical protein
MIEVKVLVRVTVKVLERVVMWRFMCWWGISGGGEGIGEPSDGRGIGRVSMEEVKVLVRVLMAGVKVLVSLEMVEVWSRW